MTIRIQRSADHNIVPWANGLGITADVCRSPDVADWVWRLSIADVTDDVPFSVMSGIDRHILVAQGAGMGLTIDGRAEIRMDRATPPLSFPGEAVTTCRLLDGPIADLNLMVRRGRATGALTVVHIAEGQLIALQPETVAVVVLAGSIECAGQVANPFDAILFEPEPAAARGTVRADAVAVVALATVRSAG